MKAYVVYILRCSDDAFYTGITGNFDFRMVQHQQGYVRECYTYQRRPLVMEYRLVFRDVIQAILLEKKIKG